MDYKFEEKEFFFDFKTSRYYSTKASSLVGQYTKGSPNYLKYTDGETEGGKRLLDIGCGTGRDLAEFLSAGYCVTGVDPSQEMLNQAANKYPSIRNNLVNTGLPSLKGICGKYDVILCSGVIQHIPPQYLYESFRTISALLVTGGTFIFSFPLEYPGIDTKTSRDEEERLFYIRPSEKYKFLLERQGLTCIQELINDDSLGRKGFRWGIQVFIKKE